ncbi:MAG: DUF4388 domain-containing protein [bacterium]|nr:DUF4388 domain-containing protein [bacterium]
MTKKKRLDEYLIELGLASESEIKIALNHQKVYGGKFGSHLLHHGFVDEEGLIRALSEQFDCKGVILSKKNIPMAVIEMIPHDFAYSRLVVPYEKDDSTQTLRVACEDPSDEELFNELDFVVKDWTIDLYIAAELSLVNAIEKYYEGGKAERTSQKSATGKLTVGPDGPDTGAPDSAKDEIAKSALLVTDDDQFSPFVKLLLEQDGYEVSLTDSANDALRIIEKNRFEAVFIKDTVPGDYLDLIDRLRKKSPSTRVRYYESAASLLLGDASVTQQENLLFQNLELFTSLLSIKDRLPTNHSGRVGQYVNRLCCLLGLPDKERMLITNTAFVHDLFKFYNPAENGADFRELVKKSAKMLGSIGYEPVAVEMLNSMYKDLKHKFTKRLPIEALGGNIITIVDLFCDGMLADEKLTLDRFEPIRIKLNDMVGTLFLPEVVEAFVEMMESEILSVSEEKKYCQIMVFSDQPEAAYPLTMRLKKDGFRTIGAGSDRSIIQLHERSRPDIMILQMCSGLADIMSLVERLSIAGVDFSRTPVYLLVDAEQIPNLTPLLERGIEDILDRQSSLDFLVLKIRKRRDALQERAENSTITSRYSGANGNIADLSMIDLIQALGPGRRSMKMQVVSGQEQLTLFLNRGEIIYAKLDEIEGPEAIYRAMKWVEGTWEIEPIKSSQMPEPNNEFSNESILMEGCRQIDEDQREKEPAVKS